jgi:hypothetical protein
MRGYLLPRCQVKTIALLGSKAKLKWTRNAGGLTIELPEQKPCEHAFVFKIEPVAPGRSDRIGRQAGRDLPQGKVSPRL